MVPHLLLNLTDCFTAAHDSLKKKPEHLRMVLVLATRHVVLGLTSGRMEERVGGQEGDVAVDVVVAFGLFLLLLPSSCVSSAVCERSQ
ncbi:hypothetical protein BaRGS_00028853, partial [Batillaria attramentaria]